MSEWIISTITQWGYVGIFLLMVAENIFPPIPSELIMPFAGFVAASGELSFPGVLIAGTLGSLVGTSAWYGVARLMGLQRFIWLCNKLGRVATLTQDDIGKAHNWFTRFGPIAVLVGRLIPAVRTLISVPAGLAAMPFWQFLLISLIGTFAWTAILTAAGLLLHENYQVVEGWIDPVSTGIVVIGVVIYLYRFVTWKPIQRIG